MAVRIEYRPAHLTFEEFHRVDGECFPAESIASEGFSTFMADDFWAAYDGDCLVAFCYVVRKPDVAWISRIATSAAYRNQGIATELMRTMIHHCLEIGLSDMMLYVESDNTAAIRLYERFGFRTVETGYQFILSRPRLLRPPRDKVAEPITAVAITYVDGSSVPQWPREWSNLAHTHRPPERYVLIFRDESGAYRGYCRLAPRFPGCFPFVVDRPSTYLAGALHSLREFLLPEKDILKLTFSDDALADACVELGLKLNYQLFKMLRPAGVDDG
jgi:GNAT superfamily N-acetyltransferase